MQDNIYSHNMNLLRSYIHTVIITMKKKYLHQTISADIIAGRIHLPLELYVWSENNKISSLMQKQMIHHTCSAKGLFWSNSISSMGLL